MLKLFMKFQFPNLRNLNFLTDDLTKELAGLDDMIFECEMYNQSHDLASLFGARLDTQSVASVTNNQSQRKTIFVETSSDEDDSVDLENVRISESNIQDNPLYTTGL